MHKTYTDCYRMLGFSGGSWAYAANTNETNGPPLNFSKESIIPKEERRLAYYFLGWESAEVCLFLFMMCTIVH